MNVRHSTLAVMLSTVVTSSAWATSITEFDHIGSLPTPYTDNLNGSFIYDTGVLSDEWRRSGARWVQSQDAQLETASFIVFIASSSVTNIDASIFNIHIWNGYASSFAVHPWEGDQVLQISNAQRTIVPFTLVGPTATEFQTFKVTYDFTQLTTPIILTGGQEYVMAPVSVFGGQFRLSLSDPPGGGDLADVIAAGIDTTFTEPPATIDTRVVLRQFGVSLTVNPVPEPSTLLLGFVGSVLLLALRLRTGNRPRVSRE